MKEGEECKIEDTLFDMHADFVTEYENKEIYAIIRKIVNELSGIDKQVVMKYFGFNVQNPMTQEEIAKEIGISQAQVSRKIKKLLKTAYSIAEFLGIELGKVIESTKRHYYIRILFMNVSIKRYKPHY